MVNTWIQRTWNGDRSGRLCNIFYHRSNSDALPHLSPIPRRSDRCVFLPTSRLHASLISSCFRSIAVPASELHLLSLVLLSKLSQVLQLSSLLHTPECSRRPYKYPQMFLVRWHSSCLCLQVVLSMTSILQLHFLLQVCPSFPSPADPSIMFIDSGNSCLTSSPFEMFRDPKIILLSLLQRRSARNSCVLGIRTWVVEDSLEGV